MIERRKAAGELIGMLEREVGSNAKPEMFGDQSHGGDEQRRFRIGQLDCVGHRRIRAVTVDIIDSEHIGKEDAVEQPALCRPGIVDPVIEGVVVDRSVARMRPQAGPVMARGGHVERVEAELSWFGHWQSSGGWI